MEKIIGSILIIGAASLLGCRFARETEDEYRQMQYLRQIIYMLQSEIRYARSYLGEAFLCISGKVKEPYKGWLLEMSFNMEHKRGGMFEEMWEQCIREYLTKTKLPEPEISRLIDLGCQLGTADMEMQMKTLELYQEQLKQAAEDKREKMKAKVRLCRCLGVSGGIFITVLLI